MWKVKKIHVIVAKHVFCFSYCINNHVFLKCTIHFENYLEGPLLNSLLSAATAVLMSQLIKVNVTIKAVVSFIFSLLYGKNQHILFHLEWRMNITLTSFHVISTRYRNRSDVIDKLHIEACVWNILNSEKKNERSILQLQREGKTEFATLAMALDQPFSCTHTLSQKAYMMKFIYKQIAHYRTKK